MATALLERPAPQPAVRACPGASRTAGPIAQAAALLARTAAEPVTEVGDEALTESIVELARLESRASALRMRMSVEADRRRAAEQTADTGTDAWLAKLTGTTREQRAGCGSRGCWRRSTPRPALPSRPATCGSSR